MGGWVSTPKRARGATSSQADSGPCSPPPGMPPARFATLSGFVRAVLQRTPRSPLFQLRDSINALAAQQRQAPPPSGSRGESGGSAETGPGEGPEEVTTAELLRVLHQMQSSDLLLYENGVAYML